jgi:hypothetical protein
LKVALMTETTHNPFNETHRVSCLRENLTSSSDGEGLETGRPMSSVPRQSFTRQICFKELKSGLGLGQAQVTKEAARVERSVAITIMAYLALLCLQAKHIKPAAAWSIFVLKQKFAWDVGAQQIKRTTQQETLKEIKKLKLAA